MTSILTSFMTAAIINKKRREMFHAFRVSGAISQATGKALDEIGVKTSKIFKLQVRRRVIVQVSGNRYYLDESRLKEVDRFRRNAVLITLIILFAAVILFSGRH